MREAARTASVRCALALAAALLAAPACERQAPESDARYHIDRVPVPSSHPAVLSIGELRAHVGSAAGPPPDAAPGWVPRSLPDFWSRVALGDDDDVWYRADFDLSDAPDELWALYLPRLRMNAAARVNGVRVGDGGRFGDRISRNWNRPLYFTLPGALLRAGPNRLEIHVGTSPASDIRLVGVEIGPDRLLRPLYEARLFRQIDLRALMITLSLATALLLGVVALRRPEIKGALYFAGALVCLAFAGSDGIVRDPPMPLLAWQWSNVVAYLVGCTCVACGTNRALGVASPKLERAAWTASLGIALFVLVEPYWFVTVNLGLLGVGALSIGYAGFRLLQAIRRRSVRNGYVLLGLVCTLMVLVLHDVQSGFTGLSLPYAPLTTFVPLVIVVFTTWMLMGYVLESLSASEQLAAELNERVEEAREELQHNYERLREMERGRAVAQERDRMMREMHDGIGGQLVSALALLERVPPDLRAAGESLREGLDDMRQMLDSVAATWDLASLLGSMRARLERRLSRHALRFDWRVREVASLPTLGPAGMAHVTRIVQEAVNNVIQHAGAATIRIETREAPGPEGDAGVRLEIGDDGCGLPRDCDRSRGHGLANMQSRAAELGGSLRIRATETGTEVVLWLPVGPPDAPPGGAGA